MNHIYCEDSLKAMKTFPDKYFELAIVDPPYGGFGKVNFRFEYTYENTAPPQEYFDQVLRVSKDQIIWGGNYFTKMIPAGRCWITWQKGQLVDNFSDFEMCWTSFDGPCKNLHLDSYGFNHADKRHNGQSTIHPTQKPVALYKWLLKNYAKEGDKILDTHGGSMSSVIACIQMGFDYMAFEIDQDYFQAAKKRIENELSQTDLFIEKKRPEFIGTIEKPYSAQLEIF